MYGQWFLQGPVFIPVLHFSCYGAVTSLNGEAEPGIIVEAVGRGTGNCQQLQEESKTEPDGSFRIRGLQVKYKKMSLILLGLFHLKMPPLHGPDIFYKYSTNCHIRTLSPTATCHLRPLFHYISSF